MERLKSALAILAALAFLMVFSVGVVAAKDKSTKVSGKLLSVEKTKDGVNMKIEMTINKPVDPNVLGFKKVGDQYEMKLGKDGFYLHGSGDPKGGAKGGIGVKLP